MICGAPLLACPVLEAIRLVAQVPGPLRLIINVALEAIRLVAQLPGPYLLFGKHAHARVYDDMIAELVDDAIGGGCGRGYNAHCG